VAPRLPSTRPGRTPAACSPTTGTMPEKRPHHARGRAGQRRIDARDRSPGGHSGASQVFEPLLVVHPEDAELAVDSLVHSGAPLRPPVTGLYGHGSSRAAVYRVVPSYRGVDLSCGRLLATPLNDDQVAELHEDASARLREHLVSAAAQSCTDPRARVWREAVPGSGQDGSVTEDEDTGRPVLRIAGPNDGWRWWFLFLRSSDSLPKPRRPRKSPAITRPGTLFCRIEGVVVAHIYPFIGILTHDLPRYGSPPWSIFCRSGRKSDRRLGAADGRADHEGGHAQIIQFRRDARDMIADGQELTS
jgi:hypothetical protein